MKKNPKSIHVAGGLNLIFSLLNVASPLFCREIKDALGEEEDEVLVANQSVDV